MCLDSIMYIALLVTLACIQGTKKRSTSWLGTKPGCWGSTDNMYIRTFQFCQVNLITCQALIFFFIIAHFQGPVWMWTYNRRLCFCILTVCWLSICSSRNLRWWGLRAITEVGDWHDHWLPQWRRQPTRHVWHVFGIQGKTGHVRALPRIPAVQSAPWQWGSLEMDVWSVCGEGAPPWPLLYSWQVPSWKWGEVVALAATQEDFLRLG